MILTPATKISILPCPDDAKEFPRERIADYRDPLCLRGIYRGEYNRQLPGLSLTVSLTLRET